MSKNKKKIGNQQNVNLQSFLRLLNTASFAELSLIYTYYNS